VVNRGIDVGYVERHANTRVERVDVVNSDRERGDRIVRTDGRNRIEAYRPRLEGGTRGEQKRPDAPANGRMDVRPGRDAGSSARPDIAPRGNVREQPDRSGRQTEIERSPSLRGQNPPPDRRREQWQQQDRIQRMREQQMQQNRMKETPRTERQPNRERVQPQLRERSQPAQRQPESRGGRENRRRG
jgi:hypothetical protein